MALELPELAARKCLELDLCGFVRNAEKADQEEDVAEIPIARVGRARKTALYVGLVRPFLGAKKHIHVRFAAAQMFDKPPRPNTDIKKFMALFDPYLGKTLRVRLRGTYRCKLTQMPFFLRSSVVEAVGKDVQVRTTGATLAVTGAPINKLTWKLLNEDQVEIVLEALTEKVFDGAYFTESLDLIATGFDAIIGKGS